MWCCCCCQRPDEVHLDPDEEEESRKPLLSGIESGSRSYQTDEVTPVVPTLGLGPIDMKTVKVAAVDKRLQDHAQLYNDHLERRQRLLDSVSALQGMFPELNTDKTIEGCFRIIRSKAGESLPENVKINRKFEYCMEIEFEGKEFDSALISGFNEFNAANRTIKEITDKGPALVSSVELVIKSEKDMKRDVLVASLGNEGPDCMQNCLNNVALLKLVPGKVSEVTDETAQYFKELMAGARVLLMPSEDTGTDEVDFPFERWNP